MNEVQLMETEVIVDHFHVVDNVAIFPMKNLEIFPRFAREIVEAYDVSHNHRIIFAAVNSDHSITAGIFDELPIFGTAIFNQKTKAIDYFVVENNLKHVKTRILDIITQNISGEIYLDLITTNPNFDVDANFMAKYGFVEPKLIDKTIRLKYIFRPSPKLTMLQISSVVSSLRRDVLKLKMFLPRVVAETMSKYVAEMNESAGYLSIVKYSDNGVALMSINSDNIRYGNVMSVYFPEKNPTPFAFHTHVEQYMREHKVYVNWPSAPDYMGIAGSYLKFNDQLVHFIPSPEGLWIVHMTPEFQKILIHLRTINAYHCSERLLRAIYKEYNFEGSRSSEKLSAIDRFKMRDVLLSHVKNYKLSNLFTDVPELQEKCRTEITADALIFNVSFIKWKRFSETLDSPFPETNREGILLTFDYISDIPGGVLPYFTPTH